MEADPATGNNNDQGKCLGTNSGHFNRSSFYKWLNTRETRVKDVFGCSYWCRIKSIFDDEHGLYGAKRIAASLNDDKDFPPINHKKVARIMKSMGLKAFTKQRRCITTRRKPGHRVMPDLVGRKFTANEPNGPDPVW